MDSTSPLRPWIMRFWFLVIAFVIVFFHLLPLRTMPGGWVTPDVLIGLAMAWSVRRPDYVPAILIGLLVLLADLLFMRPPGLMAALVVLGTENLKSRAVQLRDTTFVVEWATVTGVLLAIMLANRLVLGLVMIPQVPFGMELLQTVVTILSYPAMVLVSHYVFGVRKTNPHDNDLARQGS